MFIYDIKNLSNKHKKEIILFRGKLYLSNCCPVHVAIFEKISVFIQILLKLNYYFKLYMNTDF